MIQFPGQEFFPFIKLWDQKSIHSYKSKHLLINYKLKHLFFTFVVVFYFHVKAFVTRKYLVKTDWKESSLWTSNYICLKRVLIYIFMFLFAAESCIFLSTGRTNLCCGMKVNETNARLWCEGHLILIRLFMCCIFPSSMFYL